MTVTKTRTVQQVANNGNANEIADVAQRIQWGDMLAGVDLTKTGLPAAAVFDITSAALGSNKAIGRVHNLRVTAGGANAAGLYVVADSGATPVLAGSAGGGLGVATLSDDGKTLTFASGAAITAFKLNYSPKAAVNVATQRFEVTP